MLNSRITSLLVIIFFCIVLFFIVIILDEILILGKKQVPVSFSVSENPGFDLNDSALTFGSIPVGQSAVRNIKITNDFERPVKVEMNLKGDIRKYIYSSENNFILNSFESREINFTVLLPQNIEFGSYNGFLEIKFKRV